MGVDVDTGCPPSIAMQLLLRGEITGRGVLPAERAVPAGPSSTSWRSAACGSNGVACPHFVR